MKENNLKTLKDLFDIEIEWEFEVYKKLKAEAVKIYKAIKNGDLVIDAPTLIRWFANLTEEDLK